MIWWKVYFWVYTVLIALGIIFMLFSFSTLTIVDWVSIILNAAICLGVYAYAFNKKDLLEVKWWAIIFWGNAIYLVISLLDFYILNKAIENALPFLKSSFSFSSASIIFGVAISLPALYATYLLGNTKAKKK